MKPFVSGPRRSPSTRITRPLSTVTSSPQRSGQSSGQALERCSIPRTLPNAGHTDRAFSDRRRDVGGKLGLVEVAREDAADDEPGREPAERVVGGARVALRFVVARALHEAL